MILLRSVLMNNIKFMYNTIEGLFAGVLGLTLIDLIPLFGSDILSDVDSVVKTLMAVCGLIYFAMKGVHNYKMNTLERDSKRTENKIKLEELEALEMENEKKTID